MALMGSYKQGCSALFLRETGELKLRYTICFTLLSAIGGSDHAPTLPNEPSFLLAAELRQAKSGL